MRAPLFTLIIVLGAISSMAAAAPDTLWTRTIGGSSYEWAWDVKETSDHRYVMVGWTKSTAHGDSDIRIVKLNQDGSTYWDRTYGVTDCDDVMSGIVESADSCLYLGGYGTGQFGVESANFYMMKLDPFGFKLDEYNYDCDSATDYGNDLCRMLDGGFLMVGHSYYWSDSQSKYDWAPSIIRIDAVGNKLHHVLSDIPGIQELNRVIPTTDSGAIAIGRAGAVYVVKINSSGNPSWTKGYGGVGVGADIVQLDDGGYMAFGDRDFGYPYEEDFWLLRLNANGDSLWTKRYQHGERDLAYGLDQTADGGFVMVGDQYRNEGMDPTDMYIIRTNANGDTIWTKTVGGDQYEYAYSVEQTSDGGYIVVGRTSSYGSGMDDFYIVKLAPDVPTDAPEINDAHPMTYSLSTNYPNPFNPSTTIEYTLQGRGLVVIEILNPLGQMVRNLVNEEQSAGSHRVIWDGLDHNNRPVPTGIYLYRMSTDGVSQSKKMLLLK